MTDIIIKTISIFFCSIYFFTKISYKPIKFQIGKFKSALLLFTMTTIAVIMYSINSELTYFVPFLILWIVSSALSYEPQKSFILTSISFVICMLLYGILSFLSTIIIYLLFPNKESFPYILLAIITSILQALSIHFLCKTKRFRKGMPFLSTYSALNITTFICIFIVLFSFFAVGNRETSQVRKIYFFTILFTLAFLIYWWQAQITKSYLRSIEKRELESLRTENLEKDAMIEKLLKDNDRLATITHRDNTLISTLKNSTVNYLMTDFESKEEAIAARDKLIANIERLSEGRSGLRATSDTKTGRTFDTGISLLDELLHYMDEEAIQNNIIFSVHSSVELKDFVPNDISETELVHVIDDLLKNAFKATRNNERRMVQLQFYKLGKHFVVEVADNGVPFEIASLLNMGIEKMTTYEDGTGIGLMDIWSTKESRRATYHLEEYDSPSPFSKKISLTFDKKNRYSIRTYRKEEIQKNSKRIDLQIY